MIRLLLRAVALLLLAAGFVALVLDGTRSIAAKQIAYLNVDALGAQLSPVKWGGLRPTAENLHPMLWDPVLTTVLATPANLALSLLGIFFLLITRPPRAKIGYSGRP